MEMLTPALDAENRTPLYHQLYAFIKKEIQTGKIEYEAKLPSKRKLSAYLQISQNTIQLAYEQLIAEGYVTPRERSGYFVCKIDNMLQCGAAKEMNIAEKRPGGEDVSYDFSYHGVDLQTFPFKMWRKLNREVLNEYDSELIRLGDPKGHQKLRGSIAAYLHQSRGAACSAEQIIISSGTEFLLQVLIQLLGRDCIYGLENPGYEKLNQLFASNLVKYKAIPIDSGGMCIEQILKSNASIVCVTPAHQFPMGEIMPIGRRIELLNWANECAGRYIIEDDYDSEFKYSGKPVPALQGLDLNEKVIYMGTFSKSLSPAIRVSYMVLPQHLLKKYTCELSFIICPVPMIEQKVLCRFLEDGHFERHLNKMRTLYKRKRELLVKRIQELHNDISVLGADAGLHVLLHVKNGMPEAGLVSSAFQAGVKVYGVSKYYFDNRDSAKPATVLLGYAAMTEDEIDKAVDQLKIAWF